MLSFLSDLDFKEAEKHGIFGKGKQKVREK